MNQPEQAGKDGASARALGRDLLSNPYYAAKGMPSVTGEKLEEWHAKAVAWEVGWRAEDSIRAGTDTPRSTAGEALAPDEMTSLIQRLQTCENPMHCPHGRPTMVRLGPAEIARMFKRV